MYEYCLKSSEITGTVYVRYLEAVAQFRAWSDALHNPHVFRITPPTAFFLIHHLKNAGSLYNREVKTCSVLSIFLKIEDSERGSCYVHVTVAFLWHSLHCHWYSHLAYKYQANPPHKDWFVFIIWFSDAHFADLSGCGDFCQFVQLCHQPFLSCLGKNW